MEHALADGDIVIAAITSCTNTSNPALLIGAGLLARNARKRGLSSKPWVKSTLSPGSRVVADGKPFNCHRYFMTNPSLSGRGAAFDHVAVPTLRLRGRV